MPQNTNELLDLAKRIKGGDSAAMIKASKMLHDPLVEPEVINSEMNDNPVLDSAEAVDAEAPVNLDKAIDLSARVAIDAALMEAGFDPGIEYIQQYYGEHWKKVVRDKPIVVTPDPVVVQEPIDVALLCSTLQSLVASDVQKTMSEFNRMSQDYFTRLNEVIASQIQAASERSSFNQETLIAALAEARKPISIDVKMVLPDQKPRQFVAERRPDGSMVLTEEAKTLQ